MNYRKLMNGGIATVMLATAAFSTIAPAQAASHGATTPYQLAIADKDCPGGGSKCERIRQASQTVVQKSTLQMCRKQYVETSRVRHLQLLPYHTKFKAICYPSDCHSCLIFIGNGWPNGKGHRGGNGG